MEPLNTTLSSSSAYPLPHIIPPPSGIHETTLILLHGTSTSGPELAASLLEIFTPIPTSTILPPTTPSQTPLESETETRNLVHYLPNTRLVFPTGKLRKTTVFGGKETNAWFDVANFSDRTEEEGRAVKGIHESINYLVSLIRDEASLFSDEERGRGKIYFGGFSQGAAMSMTLFLSNELVVRGFEKEIGGWVLMSGWLPFAAQLNLSIELSTQLFTSSTDGEIPTKIIQHQTNAITWLRSHLDLERVSGKGLELPACEKGMFMGHGTEDQKVRLEWALAAKGVMEGVGVGVEWRTYMGLGHWFSGEELGVIVGMVTGKM